jgi:hypothetical protein
VAREGASAGEGGSVGGRARERRRGASGRVVGERPERVGRAVPEAPRPTPSPPAADLEVPERAGGGAAGGRRGAIGRVAGERPGGVAVAGGGGRAGGRWSGRAAWIKAGGEGEAVGLVLYWTL